MSYMDIISTITFKVKVKLQNVITAKTHIIINIILEWNKNGVFYNLPFLFHSNYIILQLFDNFIEIKREWNKNGEFYNLPFLFHSNYI